MAGSWTNDTSSVHFFFSTLVSSEKTVEFCRNCRFSLVYLFIFFYFISFFLNDLLEFRY